MPLVNRLRVGARMMSLACLATVALGARTAAAQSTVVSITFDDADTITSSCIAMMDGKEQPPHPTTLKRVKE